MPKISFIVPIYNMEKYLRRCLDSIISQTESDYEAILIDDGSTDASADICMEYVSKDTRIVYKYQENAWLSAARNTGMALARGEYISFIDADDFIEPDFIKVLYNKSVETRADIACFGHKRNIEDNVVVECPDDKVEVISEQSMLGYFCRNWLLPQRMNYAWSKLLRRDFIESTGVVFNIDARYCEDRNFFYKLLIHAKRIAYISCSPYFYYQHKGSITHSAALYDNIFKAYLNSYNDICAYWALKNFHIFDPVKPIALMRAMQSAIFNTQQTVNNLEIMADAAVKAFDEFNITDEMELNRLKSAISIFSEQCGLNWAEQSKLWLFALSVIGGKAGIVTWQNLYPLYSTNVTTITKGL